MYKEYPKITSFIQKYGLNSFVNLANLQDRNTLGFLMSDIKGNLKEKNYTLTEEIQQKMDKIQECIDLLDQNQNFEQIDLNTKEMFQSEPIARMILIDRFLQNEKQQEERTKEYLKIINSSNSKDI